MTEFMRFDRVDSVEQTDHGLLAHLHGERLRVDLVREDVVRVKISRGGSFDETPTFAVCVDPLEEPVAFDFDGTRLRTAKLVLTLEREPFALHVHRPDGTPVAESVLPYATLNDAFRLRRRSHPGDAIYGLGEKGGRHNRK